MQVIAVQALGSAYAAELAECERRYSIDILIMRRDFTPHHKVPG
jgi:hypothetical protein